MTHLLDDKSADFIIVGPIRDEAKRVTGGCGFMLNAELWPSSVDWKSK